MRKACAPLAVAIVLLAVVASNNSHSQSVPASKLDFKMLDGWVRDSSAEMSMNSYRVFVPAGKTIQTSPVAVVITFDRKDLNDKTLDTLKDYWVYDMSQTLAQEKDAEFSKWQPPALDPAKIPYMSIAITDKTKHMAPQHLVVIEAPDGFYSVSLTAADKDILNNVLFNDFFDSLMLRQ